MKAAAKSLKNSGLTFVIGFLVGGGLILWLMFFPQQKLLTDRDKTISEQARFNREEQERISQVRDMSSGELMKWIRLKEQMNAEFQTVQQRLADQELSLNGYGSHQVTLVIVATAAVMALYVMAFNRKNAKDASTMEDFHTFVSARLNSVLEFERPRKQVAAETVGASIDEDADRLKLPPASKKPASEPPPPHESPAVGSPLVACPYCNSRIRADNLARHVRRTHPGSPDSPRS